MTKNILATITFGCAVGGSLFPPRAALGHMKKQKKQNKQN